MSTQPTHCDPRPALSASELERYRGQWIAFSTDGAEILAAGGSEIDLVQKARALGLRPSDYVMEPIPDADTLLL